MSPCCLPLYQPASTKSCSSFILRFLAVKYLLERRAEASVLKQCCSQSWQYRWQGHSFPSLAVPSLAGGAVQTFAGVAVPLFAGVVVPSFADVAVPTVAGVAVPTFAGLSVPCLMLMCRDV